MDHTDAQIKGLTGRPDGRGLAMDQDLAMVGIVNAREHIHQGCLAAAVLPQQSQDLAFPQIQADIVVCHHFAEGFGDMPHRYSIFCGFLQGSPPFFCLTENKAVLSYKERLCSVCMGFTRQRCSLLQCTARTERTALPARGSSHPRGSRWSDHPGLRRSAGLQRHAVRQP